MIVLARGDRVGRRIARSPAPSTTMPLGESLQGGIRFVWREPVLLAAMTLDLFAVLFGGAVALLPAFATLLDAGPEGLGILRAAPAAGSILTGIVDRAPPADAARGPRAVRVASRRSASA